MRSRGNSKVLIETIDMGVELRCLSIMADRDVAKDGIEIKAIFAPVDLTLASHVSSLTLTLEEAIEKLQGFEEWVKVSSIEREAEKPEKSAPRMKLPSVEQTRASETWGAW